MSVARVTLLAVALVFAALLPSRGQEPQPAARTDDRSDLMQGVRTMMVTVNLDEGASNWVDAPRLYEEIKAGLRAANIAVVDKADSLFNINIVSVPNRGLVYYAADAGFYRTGQATAPNDRSLPTSLVRAWTRFRFGNVGALRARAGIRGMATGLVQEFLTQFSAANADFRGTPVADSTKPLPDDSDGLRGARSFSIRTAVAPEIVSRLPESRLASMIERRLHGAGIAVDSNIANTLIANVDSQKTSQGIFFLVTLSVRRMVVGIQRNGSATGMLGVVWHTMQIEAFETFAGDPSDAVGLAVEEFLVAYRKVNEGTAAPATTTSAPTAKPVVFSVQSLTDVCIDNWRSTVLPRRAVESTQQVMSEGQTWCRCLAPRLFMAGLSEEDKQSLLRDFVKEQGRIRNASTDERLKTACFAR